MKMKGVKNKFEPELLPNTYFDKKMQARFKQ